MNTGFMGKLDWFKRLGLHNERLKDAFDMHLLPICVYYTHIIVLSSIN